MHEGPTPQERRSRQRRHLLSPRGRARRLHLASCDDHDPSQQLGLGRDRQVTGDNSWRSSNMQGYFPKIEQNLYYGVYRHFFGRILGGILTAGAVARHVHQPAPPARPERPWLQGLAADQLHRSARHRGNRGRRLDLPAAAPQRRLGGPGRLGSILWRVLTRFQIIQFLDPNVPISSSVGREQRKKELTERPAVADLDRHRRQATLRIARMAAQGGRTIPNTWC